MNGVERKRHTVTQEDCDIARFFTKRGMKEKEIAKILKMGVSTVYKLKNVDFQLEQYKENAQESIRKSAENRAKKEMAIEVDLRPPMQKEQLVGQMEMNLKPVTETPEMSEQTKMMRFQAHLTDRIIKKLDEILKEIKGND